MSQPDDAVVLPPPTKVVVEKPKNVVPNKFGPLENCYQNNSRGAIVCSIIWSIICMLAVCYTIMAIQKTMYVTGRLSEDYKELYPGEDDDHRLFRKEQEDTRLHRTVAERYSVALIFCNNMQDELVGIIALAVYALLAVINVLSSTFQIWGVVSRNPFCTVQFVFTSGVTFMLYVTSVLVLLYTGDVIKIFGYHAAAVLIGLIMILLLYYPCAQNAFLIEKIIILRRKKNLYVKEQRVKSKGGLIHTVSAKTQTATPKKTSAATEKKSDVTTPKTIELIP